MVGFRDVLGQEQVKEHFQNAIKTKKISHAYILEGEKGIGKERIATIFANTIQCQEGDIEPCGVCHSCLQASSKSHPDVIYVTSSKINSVGVDDIRFQINQDIQIKPYSSDYKIYIVPDAEKMTIAAQNALLKTLEEPPAYAIIILLVANIKQLLPTIISRSILLNMQPLSDSILKKFLMEEENTTDYNADLCIAFARGNIGKAKKLVTSENFMIIKEETLGIIKFIETMASHDVLLSVKKVIDLELDITEFLDILVVWYRDVLLFKATNDINNLIFKDEIHAIRKTADRSSYEGIEKIIKSIDVARDRLSANVNLELTIELLLLIIKENG